MNLAMRQPKLLTVQEITAYLTVSKRTVYRMLRDHQLPAYRVGGQWRFKLEMIEAWMRRQGAPGFQGESDKQAGEGRNEYRRQKLVV